MFLSKIMLEPRRAATQRLLADVYAQHRLVMSAFPDRDETTRADRPALPPKVLYRLDVAEQGRSAFLLAQSALEPDLDRVYELHPYTVRTALAQQYGPAVVVRQQIRFRLRANPTRAYTNRDDTGARNPRRGGIFREDDQREWLGRIAQRSGFSPQFETLLVTPRGQLTGTKASAGREDDGHRIECFAVDFDGVLTVTDADVFRLAVETGIGRGKAWGCGLLSLARA